MHSELLRSPGSLSMVYLLEDRDEKKKKIHVENDMILEMMYLN